MARGWLYVVAIIFGLSACGLKNAKEDSRRTGAGGSATPSATSDDAKANNSPTSATTTNVPQPPASAGDLTIKDVPSCSLVAATNLVPKGSDTTLTLTVKGAAVLALLDGTSTAVTGGSKKITVTASKVYSASVVSAGGSGECSVAITAFDPVLEPPACSLTASPASITAGASTTLSLTSSGVVVTTLTLDGVAMPIGGISKSVSPTATTTYVGKVTGLGGSSSCSVTVSVGAPALPPAPSCSLTLAPSSITQGDASQLKLSVSGPATAATLDGASVAVAGLTKSASPGQTTIYKATVSGTGGSNTCEATLTVVPKPPAAPSCTLSASPSTLDLKNKPDVTLTVLTLEVAGASTRSEIVGLGVDPHGGRIEAGDHPTATKNYQGQVSGPGGSATCSALVTVIPATKPPVTKLRINNAGDSGPGSLRDAITRLNNDPNTDPVVDCSYMINVRMQVVEEDLKMPTPSSVAFEVRTVFLQTELPPLTREGAIIDCATPDTAAYGVRRSIMLDGGNKIPYGLIILARGAQISGFAAGQFLHSDFLVSAENVTLTAMNAHSGNAQKNGEGYTLLNSVNTTLKDVSMTVPEHIFDFPASLIYDNGIVITGGKKNTVSESECNGNQGLIISDSAENKIVGTVAASTLYDSGAAILIYGNSPGNVLQKSRTIGYIEIESAANMPTLIDHNPNQPVIKTVH